MTDKSRVGIGFDVHKFDESRPLMLGCVEFENHAGLAGHSDADVVAHATCDAMLGAAGLGDMGRHFPDTDQNWRNVDGNTFLVATSTLLRQAGWRVANIDCTVIAESPKISGKRPEMESQMASAIGAIVNVKGSRAEGLGALGRVEGIACYAVALLESV